MNSTRKSFGETIKSAVVPILITAAIGSAVYSSLSAPATYKTFTSQGQEYFITDRKTYTWKEETARQGTTYSSLGTGNGLLLEITEEKNNTDAGSIVPGQKLYIPVPVARSDIPEKSTWSDLETKIIENY